MKIDDLVKLLLEVREYENYFLTILDKNLDTGIVRCTISQKSYYKNSPRDTKFSCNDQTDESEAIKECILHIMKVGYLGEVEVPKVIAPKKERKSKVPKDKELEEGSL